MLQLISMFATRAALSALSLLQSRGGFAGLERPKPVCMPFSPVLATSCYLSHVEHCGLAERYLIVLAARSTVGFWDEVPLSDLIELYLTTKGALPLAKL